MRNHLGKSAYKSALASHFNLEFDRYSRDVERLVQLALAGLPGWGGTHADIVAGTRCGSAVVEGLNEALLCKAAEVKLLRCPRIRVDTTVVPSNFAYPTDSRLLAKAVRRIAATGC